MKYAFMSFSNPAWTLDEMLAAAKQYGYDGIEPRIDGGHKHGLELSSTPAQRAEAKQHAADRGVAIACIATGCRFADPAAAPQNVQTALQAIDLAADVGAGVIRVFGGKVPEGVMRIQAADSIAASLSALAPHAAERGVTVAIETHDDWCDATDVAAILQQVNQPQIGANWDYQHTTRVAKLSIAQAFSLLQPYIKHVHFHDGTERADKLEFLPVGHGIYDHRAVLHALSSIGYTGFLSGEWIDWEPADVHLPRELAAMKAMEE